VREDFVTRLQLQLHDAAEREARGARHPRHRPGLPVAVRAVAVGAAAAALLVLVVLLARDADRPAPVVNPGPRLIRSIVVGESASDVRGGFGSGWVYDSVAGRLLRVDPGNRRVVAHLPAPKGQTGMGLTVQGDALFGFAARAQGTTLLRYDPGANAIEWSRPAREVVGTFDLRGRHWVGTSTGVRAFDPRTGRTGTETRVPDGGAGLVSWAVVRGVPWTVRRDGTLLQLDPGSWRVVRRLRIPGTTAPLYLLATPGGGLLLSSTSGGFRRIDPDTGRTVWRIAPAASLQQWELIGSRLWYAVSGPGLPSAQLVEADVATGRTLGRVRLPTFDVFGIGRVGGEIWVSGTGGRVAIVRP
jgi:hypothetical protein